MCLVSLILICVAKLLISRIFAVEILKDPDCMSSSILFSVQFHSSHQHTSEQGILHVNNTALEVLDCELFGQLQLPLTARRAL